MITLFLLWTLVAVVEEEFFTVAANRLGATQFGISQRIAKLEVLFDVKLVERGANCVVATPVG